MSSGPLGSNLLRQQSAHYGSLCLSVRLTVAVDSCKKRKKKFELLSEIPIGHRLLTLALLQQLTTSFRNPSLRLRFLAVLGET